MLNGRTNGMHLLVVVLAILLVGSVVTVWRVHARSSSYKKHKHVNQRQELTQPAHVQQQQQMQQPQVQPQQKQQEPQQQQQQQQQAPTQQRLEWQQHQQRQQKKANRALESPFGAPSRLVCWIYTTMNPRHAAFEEAFCGYQRLALLTAYVHLSRRCRFQFVHPRNLHQFLPPCLASCDFSKADPVLLEDYCKYAVLAHRGGIWISPNAIVVQDLSALFFQLRHAYRARCRRTDTEALPIAVVSGKRLASSAYQSVGVPNDSVLMCEAGNPVMHKISLALQQTITSFPHSGSYAFSRFAPKMLLQYSMPSAYGKLARSVRVLDGAYGGLTDACGKCIQLETLMSKHSVCLAPAHMHWLSLDERMLTESRHYGWFLQLDEQRVVHSDMWVAEVYKTALRFTSGSSALAIHEAANPLAPAWTVLGRTKT
jgi:hypothetical protein